MKIKNSRLELVKLESLSKLPEVIKRTDLRYKTIYAIDPNEKSLYKVPCLSCSFKTIILDPSSIAILDTFNELYYIITSGTKEEKVTYTLDEKKILVSVFSGLSDEHRLDTAELFCHAIGNRELLDMFYSDYGKMDETRALCQKLYNASTIPSVSDTAKLYPHQYQRPRYSIYELSEDLLSSHSYICTDPDLTGKYEKISRNLKATSTMIEDSWNPIISKGFNKTRANLNINYIATVSVDVPENTHGVAAGPRELKTIKSICLVKDGKVCNSSFGIRIKSKDLVRKLKAAKVIKTDLACEGDYLVDISNLPVISKSKTSCIRSYDLGTAEAWYRLSDIAIEYLMRREYKERHKLDVIPDKIKSFDEGKTDSELYLESLGIYGDYFYHDKKVGHVSRVYDATELISNFKVLPTKETCTKNITRLLNGSGKCNPFVADFLNAYVIPDINSGINYSDLIQRWETKKTACRNKIRDLKFRLISGKSLTVCTHKEGRKSILTIRENVKVGTYDVTVSWDLKEKHVIV